MNKLHPLKRSNESFHGKRLMFGLLPIMMLVIMLLPTREAHSAISHVQKVAEFSQYYGFGPSSVVIPVTASVTAGNSIIVTLMWGGWSSGLTTTCTDDQGNSYTTDVSEYYGGAGMYSVICSAHNVTALTMSDNLTISFSGSIYGVAVIAHEFSGLASSSPLDQTASANGSSITPASGSTATTTEADELLVGAISVSGPPTDSFTPGSGYAALGSVGFTGIWDGTIYPEYKTVSATGAYQADGVLGQSRGWGAAIATYKAASSATTITLSGTVYSGEASGSLSGQTVRLLVEGASAGTDMTDGSGNYSITATVTAGDTYVPLLVYVDDGSVDGTTVTVLDSTTSTTISGLDIYADHLITRQDEGGTPLDTGDMNNAKVSYSDADILYSILGSDTTVTGINTELYVANGHFYTPQGNVTTPHIQIEGTLTGGNNTFFVGGDWTNSGTFIADTSSVIFGATSGTQTITSGSSPFYDITFNDAAGTAIFELQDALTANHDLTVIDGILDTNNTFNYAINAINDFNQSGGQVEAHLSTITVGGNFTANGAVDSTDYNDAWLVLTGTGTLSYFNLAAIWNNGFYNVTAGQSGNTTTVNHNFAILNQLTIGSGTFGINNWRVYLLGANPLSFDPNSTCLNVTLRFFSASNQNIPSLTNGYDCDIEASENGLTVTQTGNVVINGNYSLYIGDNVTRTTSWNTAGFDLSVGGNITLGAGGDTGLKTLDGTNSTITVGGDFTVNDVGAGTQQAVFTSTGSTVILNGTNQAINGSISFNNLTKSVATADTLTFAAGSTTTINGTVTLNGTTGQPLTLASSTGSSAWHFTLNAGATKAIDSVSISWSDASGSHSTMKPISPTNSNDGGNNIDWFPVSALTVEKSSTLISDPINSTGAGKNHIPGAIVEYSVTVRNLGGASPDTNTVVIYDALDANVELDVTTGVLFSDGSTSSNLALGTVSYSHISSPTSYTYIPTGSFDPSVAGIKIETTGTLAFGGSPAPAFTLSYRVRVK